MLLSSDQLHAYHQEGFLLLRQLLPPAALTPLIAQLEREVDRQAEQWLAEGRVTQTHAHLPFARRLAALAAGSDLGMRSWDEIAKGPALDALLAHPLLAQPLAQLLGRPLRWNGDYHVRPKLPESALTAFPWHQDSQYYGAFSEPLHIVTAWLPLVPVDEENGCLHVIPGSHRWGLLAGARAADMNIRCDEDPLARGTPIPLPMEPGDVVFFTNLTVHGSLMNRSSQVRWSIDLRYSSPVRDEALRPAEQAYFDALARVGMRPREILPAEEPGMAMAGG